MEPRRTSWARLLGTTLLVCLVPFVFYYLGVYQSVRASLLERNQRAIGAVAARAEIRLGVFHRVLTNSLKITDSSEAEKSLACPAVTKEDELSGLRRNACITINDNKVLEFHALRPLEPPATELEGTRLEPSVSSVGRTLRLIHVTKLPSDGKPRAQGDEGHPVQLVKLEANIEFEDFFGALDPHELFDEVSILHSTRGALKSRATRGQRLAPFVSDPPASSSTKAEPSTGLLSMFGGRDRSLEEISIGGERYLVFRRPIALPGVSATDRPGGSYSVVGLVRARTLQDQALALDVAPLLALMLVLLMAAVAGPFVKAFLIGRHDPVRSVDVHALKLALALAVGIAAIFLLAFAQLREGSRALDNHLEYLGSAIQESLERELMSAVRQLEHHESDVPQEDTPQDGGRAGNLLVSLGQPVEYPALRRLVTIGRTGHQTSKRSITARSTALIDVRTRSYFEEIQRNAFSVRCEQGWCADAPPFSMHVVHSGTSGEKVTLISVAVDDPAGADGTRILQLETSFPSLSSRLLPLGFSFALIEPGGSVLHHSDPRRSLEENLFTATNQDASFKSAAGGTKPRALSVRYLGREQRARVIPLAQTPWTLVVFSERSLANTLVLEAVVSSLTALAGLLLLLVVVRVVCAGARVSSWATPSCMPERVMKYRVASAVLGTIGLLELVAYAVRGELSTLMSCAGAALGLGVVCFIARERETDAVDYEPSWFERYIADKAQTLVPTNGLTLSASICHLAAIWALLGVSVVIPAVAFFQESYTVQQFALQRQMRVDLAQQLERRDRALEESYFRVEPRSVVEQLIAKQRDERWYAPNRPRTQLDSPQRGPAAWQAELWSGLARQLPSFNDATRRLRETERVDADESQLDRLTPAQRSEVSRLACAFPLARFSRDWVSDVAALLAALLLSLFSARVANRVLGLEHEPLTQASGPTLALDATRTLHLWLPESAQFVLERELRKRGPLHVVDLRRQEIPTELPDGCKRVLLHHFEARLVGRTQTSGALDALEQLVLHADQLAICSDVDPVYYLNEYRQDHKHERAAGLDKKADSAPPNFELPDVIRWAQLFARFDRIHHVTLPMQCAEIALTESQWIDKRRDRFAQAVTAHETWLRNSAPRVSAAPAERQLANRPSADLVRRGLDETAQTILRVECGWDEPLQSIARTMSAHHVDDTLSKPRLLQQITARAAARHRYLWSLCTNTEKLLLVHLAREGTINPNNWSVAHMLAMRGLLRYRRGRIALPSESFERFAREAMRPDDLARLERQQPSTWQQVAMPLIVLVLLAVGFFLWSQPGITEPLLAVLGAGTAGVAALLRFVSTLGDTQQRMRDIVG